MRDYAHLTFYSTFGLAFLVLSGCNAAPHYAPNATFAGCYIDADRNILTLSRDGTLLYDDARIGTYRIMAPVGGKYGYLLESDVRAEAEQDDKIIFSHRNGSYWELIPNQSIHVIIMGGSGASGKLFRKDICPPST